MHIDSTTLILTNDLDSMVARIEDLPAHPALTKALTAVLEAKAAVGTFRTEMHQERMKERFG